MSDRSIFTELKPIKKQVLERFLLSLYAIYKNHPVYPFDIEKKDDHEKTRISIYPSYSNVEQPGKNPKIVVKMGSYSMSSTETFFNDMSGEYFNQFGQSSGFTYEKMLSTSITIIVHSQAEEESSDIADELSLLLSHGARELFAQQGIHIKAVQVSETDIQNPEQNVFQTMIGVSVDFAWSGIIANKALDNVTQINFELSYEVTKLFDETNELLHLSEWKGLQEEQLAELVVGDEREWIFIESIVPSSSYIKVKRGVFSTVKLTYDAITTPPPFIIPYATAVVFPRMEVASDVGKTVHGYTDVEIQTKNNHAKRLREQKVVFAAKGLDEEVTEHEKLKVLSIPKHDRLFVERSLNGIQLTLPQQSLIYYRKTEDPKTPYSPPLLYIKTHVE
jgi:hypothetical protein